MGRGLGHARPLLEQGVALCREVDDKMWTSWWLQTLAFALLDLGEFGQCLALAAQCAVLFQELGDRLGLSYSLMTLGRAEMETAQSESAYQHMTEALALAREVGDKLQLASVLLAFGALSVARSLPEQGLRLGGAGAAILEATGITMAKGLRMSAEQAMEKAVAALGPDHSLAAWNQGRTMPLEEVIGEALAEGSG